MKLNKFGETAQKYWKDIPEHFGNCVLDEFVVMPNHVHGVIVIDGGRRGTACRAPTLGLDDDVTE